MAVLSQHNDERETPSALSRRASAEALSTAEARRCDRQLRAQYLNPDFIIDNFKRGNLATGRHENFSREKDE
jgi:hypothetical protein